MWFSSHLCSQELSQNFLERKFIPWIHGIFQLPISMRQLVSSLFLPFLLDLHIPGLWSHPGLGCSSGCALCLQEQWMGWLWQHQELQHQGTVGGKCSCTNDSAGALLQKNDLELIGISLLALHRLTGWRKTTMVVLWFGPSIWMTSLALSVNRANIPWLPPWRMLLASKAAVSNLSSMELVIIMSTTKNCAYSTKRPQKEGR